MDFIHCGHDSISVFDSKNLLTTLKSSSTRNHDGLLLFWPDIELLHDTNLATNFSRVFSKKTIVCDELIARYCVFKG